MREEDLLRVLEGPAPGRCRRLVREVLEWPGHSERLSSIGSIQVVERNQPEFSPGNLVLSEADSASIRLAWVRNREPAVITLRPERVSGVEIERLESIQLAYDSPTPELVFDQSFDSMSTARSFVREISDLIEACYPGVEAASATRRVRPRPLPPTKAKFLLSSYITKVVFVWFLQERGLLTYHGRPNYVQALYDAWREDPGSYRFYQRLGQVVFKALASENGTARTILRPLVGDVPNLGAKFLLPRAGEAAAGEQVEPVIDDEVFERLLGENGILRRYHPQFAFRDDGVDEVGLSYIAMTAAIEEIESGRYNESPLSLQRQARDTVLMETGGPGATADERISHLRSLRIYAPEAGSGAMLSAMIREATKAYAEARAELGGEDETPIAYARRLARERLIAVDDCPLNVLRANASVAQVLLELDPAPLPVPLPELDRSVQVGRAIVQTPAPRMIEDEHNEFKTAFSWNTRTQERDGRMKMGVVRTVAAFLNTSGGVLWLGVDDNGRPVGLEDELAMIEDGTPEDIFRGQVHEALKNHIEPLPFHHLVWEWRKVMGKRVAKVSVSSGTGISYVIEKTDGGRLSETIYVRDGNRTIALAGRHRDQFVISRSGGSANLK